MALHNTVKKVINAISPIKIESFENGETSYNPVSTIIWLIVVGFAVYLAFQKNNGFEPLSFLAAFCCAPLYIVFVVATTGTRYIMPASM
jgi:uncharacterized membrane protein